MTPEPKQLLADDRECLAELAEAELVYCCARDGREARREIERAYRAREGLAGALQRWASSGAPHADLEDGALELAGELVEHEAVSVTEAAARETLCRRSHVANALRARGDRCKRLRAWVHEMKERRREVAEAKELGLYLETARSADVARKET